MSKLPVTVALVSYNQVKYIAEAVKGAFAQDYDGPMEFLISDDSSTDGTIDVLRDLVATYSGPHSVRLNVNSQNLGLIPHVHKLFAMAKEDFLVCMAGDDWSRPDRVSKVAAIQERENAMLVHSGCDFMDETGAAIPDPGLRTTFSKDWTFEEALVSDSLFVGATASYHKDVFREYGMIVFNDAFEDLVLGFRAAISGRLARCDDRLVTYRVGQSLSQGARARHAKFLRAMRTRKAVAQQRRLDCAASVVPDHVNVDERLTEMIAVDRNRDVSVKLADGVMSRVFG